MFRWLGTCWDPDAIARRLVDLGLGVPALIFAEAQRPLLFFYGQGLRCFGQDDWAQTLEDPANLDRFVARLEALMRG